MTAQCATCGSETENSSDWCSFGEIKVPADDAEKTVVEEDAEILDTGVTGNIITWSEYEEVEYWECDECCPVCN